jgi:hypothetical protein
LITGSGDGQPQFVLHEGQQLWPAGYFSGVDSPQNLFVEQFRFLLLGELVGLSPHAVDPQSFGSFLNLFPAVFVVGDLGEQRHDLNGLFARWVWIPPFARQVLALAVLATQDGHGQDEMHMEACLSRFFIFGFSV